MGASFLISSDMVKKGEFPAKPPTVAEMSAAQEKTEKKDAAVAVAKASVKQQPLNLDEPLAAEEPAVIGSNYITPEKCSAVVTLQMDYILQRRSVLIRAILGSRVFSSTVIGFLAVLAYRKFNGYISDYLLRDGYWAAIKTLSGNGYFLDDLVSMLLTIVVVFSTVFVFLKFQTAWLQTESEAVPANMDKYFGQNLDEYATVKNIAKPKKEDRAIVNHFKQNSVVIDYRNSPIAFLVKKPVNDAEHKDAQHPVYEITGYGVRRVYVRADMLRDLLGLTVRQLLQTHDEATLRLKLYSFEEHDAAILRRAGFVLARSESFSRVLSGVFQMTLDTYELSLGGVEF